VWPGNLDAQPDVRSARAVFGSMRAVGGGTIVNVSSVAGLRGWANAASYSAAKLALTGFA
jgi:NAD(P)-dependent dehydrogenase (short-subunit alcohol dehydrogenase family)